VIFAHSVIAKHRLVEAFALPGHKVQVVPHGDLSVALGEPVPASLARCELELGKEQFALMFGTVEPYKGLEEVIAWWRQARPAIKLAIVGRPCSREYGSHIAKQIGDANNIIHRLEWLSDHALRAWLSAADVVVFNYRKIFTSGAASLARSYGVPVLIPKRLDTVDLHEPTPYVCRFTDFASDFGWQLDAAASVKADFAAASLWRDSCSWDKVARTTAQAYRDAVGVRE
jgi:glycosyltransferase involved in cell wall biosynthesis